MIDVAKDLVKCFDEAEARGGSVPYGWIVQAAPVLRAFIRNDGAATRGFLTEQEREAVEAARDWMEQAARGTCGHPTDLINQHALDMLLRRDAGLCPIGHVAHDEPCTHGRNLSLQCPVCPAGTPGSGPVVAFVGTAARCSVCGKPARCVDFAAPLWLCDEHATVPTDPDEMYLHAELMTAKLRSSPAGYSYEMARLWYALVHIEALCKLGVNLHAQRIRAAARDALDGKRGQMPDRVQPEPRQQPITAADVVGVEA